MEALESGCFERLAHHTTARPKRRAPAKGLSGPGRRARALTPAASQRPFRGEGCVETGHDSQLPPALTPSRTSRTGFVEGASKTFSRRRFELSPHAPIHG